MGNNRFREVYAKIQEKDIELKEAISKISKARADFFGSKTPSTTKEQLQSLEEEALTISEQHSKLVQDAQDALGITDEMVDALQSKHQRKKSASDKITRADLTSDTVSVTNWLEDELPVALENILAVVDKGWLKKEKEKNSALGELFLETPLSLVRGIRLESEFAKIHRMAQSLFVCEDYLDKRMDYDFFAGSLLIPQTAALGKRLDLLGQVGGETKRRINSLWEHKSSFVDSTAFELLVAACCVERGRDVEFLSTTDKKSPDLRVHDYPFPMVIECKRKQRITDFEIKEESVMRKVFLHLEKKTNQLGMWGTFILQAEMHIEEGMAEEVAGACVRQRLTINPRKPVKYPWGTVSFIELETRRSCTPTRLYSPNFLQDIFGWNMDLPQYDGIICRVRPPEDIIVNYVRDPCALLWSNSSEESKRKKSWTPSGLFGEATQQIPPGELGIIYLCYEEGTIEQHADTKTTMLIDQLNKFTHSAGIRIPVTLINRLYPRPIGDGGPDLIENVMQIMSDLYGDPVYFEDFPSSTFTL
jgi:hypothetical protein